MHARQYTPLPWKEVIVCLAQHHQWEAVMKLLEQMHAAVDLQACGDSSVHTMLVALATRGGNPQQAWQVRDVVCVCVYVCLCVCVCIVCV